MLAKNVNDNADCLGVRGVWATIASRLAPTVVFGSVTGSAGHAQPPVGASLLAKNVNDNADCLDVRGVWATIASGLAPTVGIVSVTDSVMLARSL